MQHIPGKRAKKYCDDRCRIEYYKKNKPWGKQKSADDEDDEADDTNLIQDPLAYIREHHGGVIDFDAGMLLQFGMLKGYDKIKRSFVPIVSETHIPKF